VRRDHEAVAARLEPREIAKRDDRFRRRARKVDEQHVLALDRPLEAGQQHDLALARVSGQLPVVQLVVVQRDGEGTEAGRGGTIDQCAGVVVDEVDGIFCRVEMKVYFQHVACPALVDLRPVCSTTPAIQQRAFRAK